MSELNKTLILRWYDEVWNQGNEHFIDEFLHPGVKSHGLGAEPLVGPHAFKPFYRAFNEAYADIKVTVQKNLTDGNYVTSLCTVKARHKETNTPVVFEGATLAEIVDGQLVNAWNFFDFLSLNLQIGKISAEQLR